MVTVVPLLVAMMGAAVLLLPRLAATAWAGIAFHWANAAAYWSAGDLAGFVVRSLPRSWWRCRCSRSCTCSAGWSGAPCAACGVATAGSWLRRGGALVLGAGVLAALVWAWWPSEQYRPIDPTERGAITDLPDVTPLAVGDDPRRAADVVAARPAALLSFPQSATGVTATAPASVTYPSPLTTAPVVLGPYAVPDVLAAGVDVPTGVLPPVVAPSAEPVPTEPVPTEPVPTEPVPTVRDPWPFVFAPPEAPMEGDNRAMAVNTVDDSVVTDLAVSWAIVTASRVEQNNEAWAMASCQRCATRAVAFQVLLMLPTSNVIAPVNAALAYNQDCTSCLTEAIASQLVVTVTDIPTAQAQALVSQAMDRIEALRGSLASYSAIQIYTLLQGAQSEILEVLRADGKLPGTVTPTPGADSGRRTDTDNRAERRADPHGGARLHPGADAHL